MRWIPLIIQGSQHRVKVGMIFSMHRLSTWVQESSHKFTMIKMREIIMWKIWNQEMGMEHRIWQVTINILKLHPGPTQETWASSLLRSRSTRTSKSNPPKLNSYNVSQLMTSQSSARKATLTLVNLDPNINQHYPPASSLWNPSKQINSNHWAQKVWRTDSNHPTHL